jgi:alpha-N-arabinofuranosidase
MALSNDCCISILFLLAVYIQPVLAQGQPATIAIHVSRGLGRVNPRVFGGNMIGYQKGAYGDQSADSTDRASGVWDPVKRCSVPEMVALAKNAGLSVARWPGGCGVHLFDWKKTVGPPEKRPDQKSGLPEFLQNCRDIGSEPLITLADYFGTAQDAADMVEYLNAPDDGKHPWAALRAADGHPTPWNVVWFEYGNESEHGAHRSNDDFGRSAKMTPQEYARNYLAYRRAMQAVDPKIKLGAVLATGFPNLDQWARPVLEIVGKDLDFAIHHSYKVSYGGNDGNPDAKTLFTVALACPDQIQDYYDRLNALLRALTGRKGIPIAVTEFNGAFVQEKPVPYRHCLGNALLNAEMLRVFLNPRNHIVMANFWQFANEYWGAVKGYTYRSEPPVKRPQYYPFELYHNHFGAELVESQVACETYEAAQGAAYGVAPAGGKGSKFRLFPASITPALPWRIGELKGVGQRIDGDTLAVEFTAGEDVNYYHARRTLPAEPNTGYRLTGWIRTEELTSGNGACFQIGDARGWLATRSAALTPDARGTADWTRVETDYITLPDTKEIEVIARRLSGAGPVKGRAFYRDVSVRKFTPERFPAVPYLSVIASRSADGKAVYLMVVNKNLDAAMTAKVRLTGFKPGSAKAWMLTGPSVDATNEQQPENVTVRMRDLGKVEDGFALTFPPHSLTALEIRANGQ